MRRAIRLKKLLFEKITIGYQFRLIRFLLGEYFDLISVLNTKDTSILNFIFF